MILPSISSQNRILSTRETASTTAGVYKHRFRTMEQCVFNNYALNNARGFLLPVIHNNRVAAKP